jgi:hypothetical protein
MGHCGWVEEGVKNQVAQAMQGPKTTDSQLRSSALW